MLGSSKCLWNRFQRLHHAKVKKVCVFTSKFCCFWKIIQRLWFWWDRCLFLFWQTLTFCCFNLLFEEEFVKNYPYILIFKSLFLTSLFYFIFRIFPTKVLGILFNKQSDTFLGNTSKVFVKFINKIDFYKVSVSSIASLMATQSAGLIICLIYSIYAFKNLFFFDSLF